MIGVHLGPKLLVVLARGRVIVLEVDLGEDPVAVGRGHGAGLLGGHVEGGLDALHPGVILERLQGGEHRLFEGRVGGAHRGTAEDQDEGRPRAAVGKLVLHQGNGSTRLGILAAAVLQGAAVEEGDDRTRQHDGGPAEHGRTAR